MACERLEELRNNAKKLYAKLMEKRRKSQSYSRAGVKGRSTSTDYEPFLRSRLTHIESEIRAHIAEHNCDL